MKPPAKAALPVLCAVMISSGCQSVEAPGYTEKEIGLLRGGADIATYIMALFGLVRELRGRTKTGVPSSDSSGGSETEIHRGGHGGSQGTVSSAALSVLRGNTVPLVTGCKALRDRRRNPLSPEIPGNHSFSLFGLQGRVHNRVYLTSRLAPRAGIRSSRSFISRPSTVRSVARRLSSMDTTR